VRAAVLVALLVALLVAVLVALLVAAEIEMVVRDQPQPPLLQTNRSLKRWVKAE
jgi:hypothetical protein